MQKINVFQTKCCSDLTASGRKIQRKTKEKKEIKWVSPSTGVVLQSNDNCTCN